MEITFSPIRGIHKILVFFLNHPEQRFYGEELSRMLNMSAGYVHSGLMKLLRDGILTQTSEGKTILYALNESAPCLRSLKITQSIRIVCSIVKSIGPLVREIYLFGSSARGKYLSTSDIDLAIICDQEEKERVRSIIDASTIDRKLQAHIMTSGEFLQLREKDPAFYEEIIRGINMLNRPEDEPEL